MDNLCSLKLELSLWVVNYWKIILTFPRLKLLDFLMFLFLNISLGFRFKHLHFAILNFRRKNHKPRT